MKFVTFLISPNLLTYLEFPSPSPLLIPPKQFSVKIEEVEDVENQDIEIHSPSPSPSKISFSQYISLQVLTVIPHKQDNNPQPGEDVPPLRYNLRKSTCETRVPHREGNIYGENHSPTDILRCFKWQQHLGKADLDMVYRILENAHRYIQVQLDTIPIREVYYLYSQWNNIVDINGIHYKVDWVRQQPIIIDIEGNRIDAPLQQTSQPPQLLLTIWYSLQEKGEQSIFVFSWY